MRKSLGLLVLPLSVLGSLANARQYPSHLVDRNRANYFYHKEDDSELLDSYDDSQDNKTDKFTYPSTKNYSLSSYEYIVGLGGKNCSASSGNYHNICNASVTSHQDLLITKKSHIMINSLKGVDLKDNNKVKWKPNNLNYDDWTTKSIDKNQHYQLNWKNNYKNKADNVFKDTYVSFDTKNLLPFTSQRYSLFVERNVNYGQYIPMYQHNSRFESNVGLGVHTLTSPNSTQYSTSLSRSLTSNLSHVRNVKTDKSNNWGSAYMSWKSCCDDHLISFYTPVPLSDKYEPYELTPVNSDTNKDSTSLSHDLFHVNYDDVVLMHVQQKSTNQTKYPFSLNVQKIKQLSRALNLPPKKDQGDRINMDEFFKISDNFHFYLNYSYQGKKYKTKGYTINQLINVNHITLDHSSSNSDPEFDQLYLSIEPIDKHRVELINPGYPNWMFSVAIDRSATFKVNSNQKTTTTRSSQSNSNKPITVNVTDLRDLFPSQLNYYDYLANVLINDNQSSPLSPSYIQYTLHPVVQADDFNGNLSLSYFDPQKGYRVTKNFTNMRSLNTYFAPPSYLVNDSESDISVNDKATPSKRALTHSSVSNLSSHNIQYFSDHHLVDQYWKDNMKLTPIDSSDPYNPQYWKVDISGLNNFPSFSKQWTNSYNGKIFKTRSNFSLAPVQKEYWITKAPSSYQSNSSDIWSELLDFNILAESTGLKQSDFTVSTKQLGADKLQLDVSLNKHNHSYTQTYNFAYDQSKLENGNVKWEHKLYNPVNLRKGSYQPPVYDLVEEHQQLPSFWDQYLYYIIGGVGGLVGLMSVGFAGYKVVSYKTRRTRRLVYL